MARFGTWLVALAIFAGLCLGFRGLGTSVEAACASPAHEACAAAALPRAAPPAQIEPDSATSLPAGSIAGVPGVGPARSPAALILYQHRPQLKTTGGNGTTAERARVGPRPGGRAEAHVTVSALAACTGVMGGARGREREKQAARRSLLRPARQPCARPPAPLPPPAPYSHVVHFFSAIPLLLRPRLHFRSVAPLRALLPRSRRPRGQQRSLPCSSLRGGVRWGPISGPHRGPAWRGSVSALILAASLRNERRARCRERSGVPPQSARQSHGSADCPALSRATLSSSAGTPLTPSTRPSPRPATPARKRAARTAPRWSAPSAWRDRATTLRAPSSAPPARQAPATTLAAQAPALASAPPAPDSIQLTSTRCVPRCPPVPYPAFAARRQSRMHLPLPSLAAARRGPGCSCRPVRCTDAIDIRFTVSHARRLFRAAAYPAPSARLLSWPLPFAGGGPSVACGYQRHQDQRHRGRRGGGALRRQPPGRTSRGARDGERARGVHRRHGWRTRKREREAGGAPLPSAARPAALCPTPSPPAPPRPLFTRGPLLLCHPSALTSPTSLPICRPSPRAPSPLSQTPWSTAVAAMQLSSRGGPLGAHFGAPSGPRMARICQRSHPGCELAERTACPLPGALRGAASISPAVSRECRLPSTLTGDAEQLGGDAVDAVNTPFSATGNSGTQTRRTDGTPLVRPVGLARSGNDVTCSLLGSSGAPGPSHDPGRPGSGPGLGPASPRLDPAHVHEVRPTLPARPLPRLCCSAPVENALALAFPRCSAPRPRLLVSSRALHRRHRYTLYRLSRTPPLPRCCIPRSLCSASLLASPLCRRRTQRRLRVPTAPRPTAPRASGRRSASASAAGSSRTPWPARSLLAGRTAGPTHAALAPRLRIRRRCTMTRFAVPRAVTACTRATSALWAAPTVSPSQRVPRPRSRRPAATLPPPRAGPWTCCCRRWLVGKAHRR